MSLRTTNAEAGDTAEVGASPKPTTPIHQPTHNTRVKPTREAGSAWTTCYARQGKPEAGGPQRDRVTREHGIAVRKLGVGRGQQGPKPKAPPIRKPCSHPLPSGANLMRPKPSEAKRGTVRCQVASATDQRRSQRRSRCRRFTEADNTNTPTHA